MSQPPPDQPSAAPAAPATDLTTLFPQGEGIQAQIARRQRNATIWRLDVYKRQPVNLPFTKP